MIITPRTDAESWREDGCMVVDATFAEKLETELAEAKAHYEWKPIDTAPKNSSAILVLRHRFIVMHVRWCKTLEGWQSTTNGEVVHDPSHWANAPILPVPPDKDKRQQTFKL